MPDVISFDEVVRRTEGEDRSLLIGNEFSIEHFSYKNLLEKSGLDEKEPIRELFGTLGTYDFETVIRALEDAVVVEDTHGNGAQARTFQADADRLREALVHAVRETHPAHRADTEGKRLPLYVAEGTSQAKLAKVNSVPYLRHCYDQLADSTGNVFVYGHSADQNDTHIYRALFRSGVEHIYFFIHQPTTDLDAISGELVRYKAVGREGVDYSFVDSESARVWDYVF